jgi:murein DD-endopeptidase MepM/ murein hydrolase activator NlpD
MTIIHYFNNILRKIKKYELTDKLSKIKILNFNIVNLFFFAVFFSILYFISFNLASKKNLDNQKNLSDISRSSEFSQISNFLISKINSPYKDVKYTIKKNDSVEKILNQFSIRDEEVKEISLKLKQKKLTNIYSGRELKLIYKKLENQTNSVVSLLFPINNTSSIEVRKSKNKFIVKENILKLYKKEVVVKSVIKNNLYNSATQSGIEPNIIIEFARIFGFEVDFQRDIRKGDWFELLYEKFEDDNERVRDTGKIIYASMFVNGEEINLYHFKDKNSDDFFNIKGQSITKSLMKTPINGARLSSSFGMRKHPILGYNKMHRGTDFAAPSGTPIMASGSGTITRARWCGGGGNCVKIKHNSTYETIYAHMKSFAKGIKEGRKVKQGQIIGYVGSTGMSTGPHLHYEVVVNGKKVNSQRLKLPSGKKLKGEARKDFELKRIKIDLKLSELR